MEARDKRMLAKKAREVAEDQEKRSYQDEDREVGIMRRLVAVSWFRFSDSLMRDAQR